MCKLSKLDSLIEATQWVQSMTADDIKELSREPVEVRAIHSMLQAPLAGLKTLFGREKRQPRLQFADYYFWGPFALYGAWE